MFTQRFDLGDAPRLVLESVAGDVQVEAWEEAEVLLQAEDPVMVSQEGNLLRLESVATDVQLRVPRAASLQLESVSGDVLVNGVQGEVVVETVAGEVELINVARARLESAAERPRGMDIARRVRAAVSRSLPFAFEFGARRRPREQAVDVEGDAERLAILRMLQEKKITAEEAERLLQALE